MVKIRGNETIKEKKGESVKRKEEIKGKRNRGEFKGSKN